MKRPWLKFYPADWRADPALRMCSIGARGFWMEMLCLMHEAVPYGSLLVKGAPVSERQLAGLAGISLRDAAGLLAELEAASVFSKDEDGTIFSRRMRWDHARAEEGRESINRRWGNRPPNRVPKSMDDRGATGEPITLEARSQNPERKKENGAVADATRTRWSQDFENGFWKPYPRTPVMSKAEAWKAWQKSTDVDRATRFYAGLFGWQVAADPAMGGYGLVDTGAGDGAIGGGIGPSEGAGNGVKIYMRVDDLDAYLDQAEALGGQRLVPPTDLPGDFGRFAIFTDPDGNPVGLWA